MYVRSLAERELSIPIVKLPSSQDIRSLKISSKKCYKIAKIYFENVLAISNEVQQETQKLSSNAPDVAAENFVELCIADAGIEEKYYPMEGANVRGSITLIVSSTSGNKSTPIYMLMSMLASVKST